MELDLHYSTVATPSFHSGPVIAYSMIITSATQLRPPPLPCCSESLLHALTRLVDLRGRRPAIPALPLDILPLAWLLRWPALQSCERASPVKCRAARQDAAVRVMVCVLHTFTVFIGESPIWRPSSVAREPYISSKFSKTAISKWCFSLHHGNIGRIIWIGLP